MRKAEVGEKKLLKGHRFTLLHLQKNLPEGRLQELDTILLTYPSLGKAYSLKEGLVDILHAATAKSQGAWENFLGELRQCVRGELRRGPGELRR